MASSAWSCQGACPPTHPPGPVGLSPPPPPPPTPHGPPARPAPSPALLPRFLPTSLSDLSLPPALHPAWNGRQMRMVISPHPRNPHMGPPCCPEARGWGTVVLDFRAQKVAQPDLPRAPHSAEKGPAWLLSWLSQDGGPGKTPCAPRVSAQGCAGPSGPHTLVGSWGSSPGPGSHPLSSALLGALPRLSARPLPSALCPDHPAPPPQACAPGRAAPQRLEAPLYSSHQPLQPRDPPAGVWELLEG